MATGTLARSLSLYMRGLLAREADGTTLAGAADGVARAARAGGGGAGSKRRRASFDGSLEVAVSAIAVKHRRLSQNLSARGALGQEAFAFREQYVTEHGHKRGVWLAFQEVLAQSGADVVPSVDHIRHACRLEEKRQAGAERVKLPKGRRRARGGGRIRAAPELGEELWHWFVDRINTVQARINSKLLLAQAEAIKSDLMELHHLKVDQGRADAAMPPHLPSLNRMWLQRWREKYGISHRTVNLRYKISTAKRESRLHICWSNALRLRVLHRALFLSLIHI